MRCLPSLTLSFKAHVLGSTSARVALASRNPDPAGKRYALALRSLSNSETAMCRAYWKGKLPPEQLLLRARKLAALGAQLPASRSSPRVGVARLLQACNAKRPAEGDADAALAKALGTLMATMAVTDGAGAAQPTNQHAARTRLVSDSSHYPASSSSEGDSDEGGGDSCDSFVWRIPQPRG
jgi:hypothetical protein